MTTEKTLEGTKLTVAIHGRVDTKTSPQLEKELLSSLDGVTELILDFADVEYISSDGLRTLLNVYRTMYGNGNMKVIHPNELVQEVFEVTGYLNIMDIEC